MKKYILIFSLFIMLTIFSGCYTVVWSPDTQLPTAQDTSEEYYLEDGYYADPYYGGYGYYYQYPWWLNITSPTVEEKTNRSDNSTVERIRDREGARNTGDRSERIINNNPVTTSQGSNSNSGSSNKTSESKKENEKSNNNSGSNTVTRPSSDSNDTNRARNNEGTRNNGGRR